MCGKNYGTTFCPDSPPPRQIWRKDSIRALKVYSRKYIWTKISHTYAVIPTMSYLAMLQQQRNNNDNLRRHQRHAYQNVTKFQNCILLHATMTCLAILLYTRSSAFVDVTFFKPNKSVILHIKHIAWKLHIIFKSTTWFSNLAQQVPTAQFCHVLLTIIRN